MDLDRARTRCWRLRDAVLDSVFGTERRRKIFEDFYRRNAWNDPSSRSGSGSNLDATADIRRALPELWRQLGVRSLLDAPCGDFFWMRSIVGNLDEYVGVDIARPLIEQNQAFASDRIRFAVADLATDPLPACDMILCRDCFIHLPTRLIRTALANFSRSGARWILLTTTPGAAYEDIPIGSCRPVDLTAPPFSLPQPEWSIEDGGSGRLLGLWPVHALASVPGASRPEHVLADA